jgi:hypothetical protein
MEARKGYRIYHYSTSEYASLKTRRAQGVVSEDEYEEDKIKSSFRGKLAPSSDHISLFMERPPLEELPDIFKGEHPFWKKGTKLYEYVIEVNDLPDFMYEVVESPASIAVLDNVPWFENRTYKKLWFSLRAKVNVLAGNTGNSKEDLLKTLQDYEGMTREKYLEIPNRKDYEGLKTKYAATVPHLYLYPEGGVIEVSEVNEVVL